MARILTAPRAARRAACVAALTAAAMLSTSIASSAPSAGQPERIVDNETVYVVADASGSPQTTVVVDWLQVEGTGTFEIVDPAPGIGEIESLTDGFEPKKEADAVAATVAVDGHADFFYRAQTTTPLPLDISVRYFLDGIETVPAELAGRDGRLRLEITLENHLERSQVVSYVNADGVTESREVTYTVPMLCIPQLEIDGTRMTRVVPPDGAQLAITGSTLTYAIPMVPSPVETVAIEMDARDIELAAMIVSAFPTLPASPDFSVTEEFAELRDGLAQLRQLSEGHLQVVQGISGGMGSYDLSRLGDASAGLAQLQGALSEMETGASGLAQLAAGQHAYLDGVIAGIDTSQFDSLPDLVATLTLMRQTSAELEIGVSGLLDLTNSQVTLLQQMDALNAAALDNAVALAARYPDDPEAAALAEQLGQLDALFEELLSSDAPGLPYLAEELASIRDGLSGLRSGLEAIEAQAGGLGAVPAAFAHLRSALVVLRDGGDVDGPGPQPAMPGLQSTRDGLSQLAAGLGQAAGGLADSAGQLAVLQQVPTLMADLRSALDALAAGGTLQGRQLPGIDTTVGALGEVASGLGTGVDEMRRGEALTQAMEAAADAYTSFLGLPEGATGNLSFLFKLEGVSQ